MEHGKGYQPGSGRRLTNKKILIITAVAGFVLVGSVCLTVALIFILRPATSTPTSTPTPTTERLLERLSESVRENMDRFANPCDDFYRYSCGGWNRRNPIPSGASSTSRFTEVNTRNIESLRDVIGSGRDNDVRAVQLARQLYDSCTNTRRLNDLGSQPLAELIKNTGGWNLIGVNNDAAPSWAINSEEFANSHAQGNDALFTLSVGIDLKNSSRHITQVIQSGLTVPSRLYTNSRIVDALAALINNILRMLRSGSYTQVATTIARIERDLAQIFVSNDERDPNLRYNPISLRQMQQTYWNQFNWTSYMKTRFTRAGVTVTDDLIVNVVNPSYFSRLTQVFSRYTTSQWENYFKWRLIARYFGFLGTENLQIMQLFHQATEGVAVDSSRAVTCVGILQSVVPHTLARLYTKNILPNGTREEMSSIARDVMTAFKDNLEDNTWLDQQTIDASVDKVNAVIKDVAYPEFIFNDTELLELSKPIVASGGAYFNTINFFFNGTLLDRLSQLNKPVDRNQWLRAPTEVNAFYSPSLNKIVFEEGILNAPFMMAGWPRYFQLGAIGMVAGHELSHGFDDQGHRFNKNGNLQQWWTNASLDAFSERAQCFVDQYSNYRLMGMQINGRVTLGENIADNGGLRAAYRAYTSLKQSMPQERLPSSNLTPDQLFFVAFSQLWCSAYTSDGLSARISTGPHSPGPIRVLGTLSNSAEFATAFNCPVNSPMNPSNKCKLW